MVLRPKTPCSTPEKRKLRSKASSGIRLALIRCSSRDDKDSDIFGKKNRLEMERNWDVGR